MNKEEIKEAVKKCKNGFFPMEMVGEDADAVVKAVNQGIDAHLEALVSSNFKWQDTAAQPFPFPRLMCKISPEDMPVLLRRLREGDESAQSLAESIEGVLERGDE